MVDLLLAASQIACDERAEHKPRPISIVGHMWKRPNSQIRRHLKRHSRELKVAYFGSAFRAANHGPLTALFSQGEAVSLESG
jgi:hypothetical protein